MDLRLSSRVRKAETDMVKDDPNLYLIPTLFDVPWHVGQLCIVRIGPTGYTLPGQIGYGIQITQSACREEVAQTLLKAETEIIHWHEGASVKLVRSATVDLISIKKNEFMEEMYLLEFYVHP